MYYEECVQNFVLFNVHYDVYFLGNESHRIVTKIMIIIMFTFLLLFIIWWLEKKKKTRSGAICHFFSFF